MVQLHLRLKSEEVKMGYIEDIVSHPNFKKMVKVKVLSMLYLI